MKSDKSVSPSSKRPYTKPRLEVVSLRPEEAVLGSCKTTSGFFSGPAGSGACNFIFTCSTVGS